MIFYLVIFVYNRNSEFKINILARELIDIRKSFNLVFHVFLLCFIQMNLYKLAAIRFHMDSLAHNFTCKNQVLQDGIIRGCQSASPRAPLLIFCTVFSRWLRQNSLSNIDNMLPTELFLQFVY